MNPFNPYQLVPTAASHSAREVDAVFWYLTGVSAFFTLLIFGLIILFVIVYRRRPNNQAGAPPQSAMPLEIAWTVIPLLLELVMFYGGAKVFSDLKRPPADPLVIDVIGKQWMWKIEHPQGAREINELHVPAGRPVQLVMTSQDVIHDFGLPEFRLKQDVLPGSYSTEWFTATRPGIYHLFCDQYCGTDHAKMLGRVIVMAPQEYQAWLAGVTPNESPVAAGSRLFAAYGCAACHGQRGPTMAGLYRSQVKLDSGQTVVADENYLRRSIVDPASQVVAGYPPIMPTFRGVLSEEQMFDVLEYIKSLGSTASATGAPMNLPSTQPVNGYAPERLFNNPPAPQLRGTDNASQRYQR